MTTLLYALESAATEQLRAAREAKGEPLDPSEIRGMDQEEILCHFYGKVVFDHTPKGWARPFDPDAFRGVKLLEPLIDAATGEVVAEGRGQADRPPGPPDRRKHQGSAGRTRRSARPLHGGRPGQRGNRRDLRRSRRGTGRGAARRPGRGRHHQPADAGGRSVQRPVDPQHPGGGQEHQPRRRADRHLPRHAPWRAADPGDGGSAVPRPVLRRRSLRPVRGRPGEDEHAPRASRTRRTPCACCARTTC